MIRVNAFHGTYRKALTRQIINAVHRSFSTDLKSSKKIKNFYELFQDCSKSQDFPNGAASHAQMVVSGFTPTVFVYNCLLNMYIRCSELDLARILFDKMPHRDVVSWNAMISGFSTYSLLNLASSYFAKMPEKDVVSWNSIISGYIQNGDFEGSIDLFIQMVRSSISPDHTTFAVVLKSCSSIEESELGRQIHGMAVKLIWVNHVVVGSALVDMYAKCKHQSESLKVFYHMPEKNWVSWSAVIAGCVQNEQYVDGLDLFIDMQRAGLGVSQSIYASIFRACAGLPSVEIGSQIHTHALKTNFNSDVVVGTAILDMYAKGNNMDSAKRVFELLPVRGPQSWNAIIVGYTRNTQPFEAIKMFKLMAKTDAGVNEISLSGVFSACAEAEALRQGLQVHCMSVKKSYISDICVSNAILDMYGKCGALDESCRIFRDMDRRDAVSWNAIITSLEQNEEYENTLTHYALMLQSGMEPDVFTYGSILKACAALQSLNCGLKIHDRIIKSGLGFDPFLSSGLIDMYCKCGILEEAYKLHTRLDKRQTVVSWNTMISGFSLQKQSEDAQQVFMQMLSTGIKPDSFTYATVLDTCANIATSGLGSQIHAKIIKEELLDDTYILSTLVDMYAKCGNMEDSSRVFKKMVVRDFISWNALICGYSHHGFGLEAICMFERMQEENVIPNHATFLAVLRACCHVGFVEKGEHYFHLMKNIYKLEPQLEHYSCMVDLIARCRGTKEAVKVIYGMPCEADDVIWRTLLSACKIHGDVETAELAIKNLLCFDPEDSAAYILLSNIYAEAGMWGEVSRIRRILRENRLKKEPGCSWIEVKNEMHTFLAGDKAHPKCDEIYQRLSELISQMKRVGYAPDSLFAIHTDKEEESDTETSHIAIGG